MNDNIHLDVGDAIEIAEVLEYLMERLDACLECDLCGVADNNAYTYGLDDLREDVVRLTNKLYTSPIQIDGT